MKCSAISSTKVRNGASSRKKISETEFENFRQDCFGNIRMIVVGSAYSNEEAIRTIETLGIRVFQGYGITECSPLVSVNRNNFYEAGTVGSILPDFDIRIIDDELRIKGYGVMKGYYGNPEATAAAFDDSGWFRTGDRARMTRKGNLKIMGRMKNLIVFKNGKKISPESLEAMLMDCPMISGAKVYSFRLGKDTDDVGISASVYPDPEESKGLTDYEVYSKIETFINQMNETMPIYQQIRNFSIRNTPFETTSLGKIK